MVTSGGALLIAIVILAARDFITFRSTLQSDIAAAAAVVGQNGPAAISFQDHAAATQNLMALRGKPSIRDGCIYDESGNLFASYMPAQFKCPASSSLIDTGLSLEKLTAYRPIILADKPIGAIYIESGLDELVRRLKLETVMFLIVLAIAALTAYLISSQLQPLITGPLFSLSEIARKISRDSDFSLRAKKE